jgi:PAS domain S-box-containing protein
MDERAGPAGILEAFARTGDGVFAVDGERRVVYCNAACEHMLGVEAAAVLGAPCDEVMRGFEASGAVLCSPECRVLRCSRQGRAAEAYDMVRAVGRGGAQWLNVSIVVLRGRSRSATLTVHLLRDVTARREVEHRAAALLDRLSTDGDATGGMREITRREAEVLRLLACGASNRAIGETLGISPTTVRNHIEHLLAKLGVHSKLEAVLYAARHRVV